MALWGEVSRLHLPTMKSRHAAAADAGASAFLESLAVSPQAFLADDTVARAYAQSWATVHYLAVRRKEALIRLLREYQQAAPGVAVGAKRHTQLLEDALGESLAEGEASVLKYAQRLRSPR